MMTSTLQKILLPKSRKEDSELYYRNNKGLTHNYSEKCNFSLEADTSVSFNTFYNAFSITAWRKGCDIYELFVECEFCGVGIISIYVIKSDLRNNENRNCVLSQEINSINDCEVKIPIENLENFDEGIFYIEIKAISKIVINSIAFTTNTTAKSKIKLGLVIVHYNREQQVTKTIERFCRAGILQVGKIELIIIDNSKTLSLAYEKYGVKVIASQNYGGSGGFARGMLYLKDSGFTHCCFMDDDANCNCESIQRTYSFFTYSKLDEKIAVSGILMKEEAPYLILERGARFKSRWDPISHNADMRKEKNIVESDKYCRMADYGAWCYFAFKLSDAIYYPFPFFVRGDDILFGLMNQFKIFTLNGICTNVDDFGLKDSIVTRYLGLRSELVINAYQCKGNLIKRFKSWYLHSLNSYNYSSVEALNCALNDFLNGPNIFLNDLKGKDFINKLNKINNIEKLELDLSKRNALISNTLYKESKLRKIIRRITLNGFLIPSLFFKDIIVQRKGFSVNLSQTYLYHRILHYDPVRKKGYVSVHNKKIILLYYFKFLINIIRIIVNQKEICYRYHEKIPLICKEDFWRQRFCNNNHK